MTDFRVKKKKKINVTFSTSHLMHDYTNLNTREFKKEE